MIAQQPYFNTMRGAEDDPTLVLDIGPDGKDRSTSALDMTPQGDWILGGKYGTGDGTGDCLLNSTANWRSGDSAGTIVAWVRRAASGAAHDIFASCDEASTAYYFVMNVNAGNYFSVYQRNADTYDYVFVPEVIEANEWHCLVLVSDGAAYTMYIDGVAKSMTVGSGANNGDWLADTAGRDSVTVGAEKTSSGIGSSFNGDIANVRVYSEAKTADWIALDFERGVPDSSLVLAVDGRGQDRSRYGLSFTPQADAVVGGRHMSFDGTGDYLLNSTANWRSSDSAGTIMAWGRLTSVAGDDTILASCDTAGNGLYFTFIASSGRLMVVQRNNDTYDQVRGGSTLAINRWYHMALVSSGTAWTMYLNGVAETLSVLNGANNGDWLADTSGRDNVTIGGRVRVALDGPWVGDLADVRYYDEAKAAAWIAQYYTQTRGQY